MHRFLLIFLLLTTSVFAQDALNAVVDAPDSEIVETGSAVVSKKKVLIEAKDSILGVAWSPNGSTIAFGLPDGTYLIPFEGGEPTLLSPNLSDVRAWIIIP